MSKAVQGNAGDSKAQDGWRLRLAALGDLDGLHAQACEPLVYRYLFDGVAPEREAIADRIAQSVADMAEVGVGMWVLESASVRYSGCVHLQPDLSARCAEITYWLDPGNRGQGLATRMAWTVITQAFLSLRIDCVFAGVDLPNAASLAVIGRLGMRFRRQVRYPLGAGAEYALHRGDAGPRPRPALLPLC